ncbi:MAG: ABC transporter substrate-binding protein [Burkholderiales bacterium]|nr:ABC transporter substrate-binding protein [Burkholderiales bacterium]
MNGLRRRGLLQRAAAACCALPCVAWPAGSAPRIVMVTWRGPTAVEAGFTEFWKTTALSPRFEMHDAAQDPLRLVQIAREVTAQRPELVYAWGTPCTLGLMGAYSEPHPVIGREIPLVFALVADPVGAGIVASLQAPGRNATGVSHMPPVAAHWQAMRRYGDAQSVAVLYNGSEPNSVANVREWRALAQREGIALHAEAFESGPAGQPVITGVEARIAGLRRRGARWLYLGPDTFVFTHLQRIATGALAAGLRTFASTESQINAAAPVLAGLVSRFSHVGQFAAHKANQLLSGQASVPVETLSRFSLVVRLQTARALGALPPLGLIDHAEFRR